MDNAAEARNPGEGKQTGTEADRRVVAVDYETFYRKGEYSLSNMTVWEYCHDRRFDAYLVSIYGPDISPTLRKDGRGMQLYVGRPELFDGWERLRGRTLLAHNAAFDSAVTERLIELGTIPELPGCRWCCTADCAGYHCIRRNLANVMKVGFGRDILAEKTKVRDVGMDGRHVEELTPEEYRDLVAYAGHDAIECREVWEKYAIPDGTWYGWPEREREISGRIREACKRGFAVDVAYAEQCLKALKTIRREAEDRIPWTKWHKRRKVRDRRTGEIAEVETSEYYTPLSPVGLRDAVLKAGVKPPSSFAKNDPGFIDWIEGHMDLDFVYARQRYASVNVHIGAIEKLLRMVDPNGIVRPNLTYFGAATGRTSSRVADESREDSDNVNMLNLPRSPIMKGDPTVKAVLEPWYAEMKAKDPSYPEVCTEGVDLRGMYVSRPGYRYVVFDYSQVEARFSLWYVGDTHMMGALEREGNLYQANAVAMNWCKSGEKIKKTSPDTYRLAKCCVLGLGYGMGANKFVDSCKVQGLILPVLPKDQWNEPTFVTKSYYDANGEYVEDGFKAKLFDRSKFAMRSALHLSDAALLDPENEERVGRFLYSQKTVNEWRAANGRIVAKWNSLAEDFKRRVQSGRTTFSVRLPSGRIKWYWYPKIQAEETEEWDEHGRPHTGIRYAMSAVVLRDMLLKDQAANPYGVRKFFTGGHLLENIVQATCRDVMEYGAGEIAAKHPSWKFCWSCYDEVVFEVPESEVDEALAEMPEIMCRGESIRGWTQGLPLEVEGCASRRYMK